MKTTLLWIEASRPKTLLISISPVLLGISFAFHQGFFSLLAGIITLLGALSVQIGTNLANDYYDFLKGADTPLRKGPRRLVQVGLISASQMRLATFLTFSITALLSIYLSLRGGPIFSLLSAISIFLGIGYTGGPWPLAYLGLGEIFVFLFFGPIATAAAAYLQTLSFSWETVFLGFCPGLLATAILAAANLRDIEEDRTTSKKTLATRFGKRFAQIEYTFCLLVGCLLPLSFGFWLSAFALIPALIPLKTVWRFTEPQELNVVLAQTGKILFLIAVLLSFALITTAHAV